VYIPGLAVVIIVDGECADVVTAGGRERDGVAVLLAGGERDDGGKVSFSSDGELWHL